MPGTLTPLRVLYLLLCVAGVVLPFRHFLPFMAETGYSIPALVASWQVNGGTRGLLADLSVSATAFAVWCVADCRARRDPWGLVALPCIVLVGLSLALPLHLFLRSR